MTVRSGRVPGVGVGRPGVEEVERLVEPVVETGDAEGSGTPGGELQRERDTVEPAADGVDSRIVRVDVSGRRDAGDPVRVEVDGVGVGQRSERDDVLARQPEPDPARPQDPNLRGRRRHAGHQLPGARDHVLAVVEHEQDAARC